MEQETFREFERFCLEYDIAIDEEDYLFGWKEDIGQWPLIEQLNELDTKDDIKLIYDFNFLENHVNTEEECNAIENKLATKVESDCKINASHWDKDMKRLVLVKRTRAVLQGKNSTKALDSLDYLALYLVKHIPEFNIKKILENKEKLKKSWNDDTTPKFLLHIMYLNEISSCYRGFVSIGYSDQCLHLIKEILGKDGVSPYELIALYNKGQGYSHCNNYEMAYLEFEKVIKDPLDDYFTDNKDSFKFNLSDTKLFQKIACVPAQKMMAECLLKQQRSVDAERLFIIQNHVNNFLIENQEECNYQIAWNSIMKMRSKIDQDDISENVKNDLEQLEKDINRISGNGVDRPNLKNQLITLRIEYKQRKTIRILEEISKSGMDKVQEDITPGTNKIEDAFKLLKLQHSDLVDMLKEQISNSNRDELTQTIYLWVRSLNVASKYIGNKYNDFKQEKFSYSKDQLKIEFSKICDKDNFHKKTCEVLQDKEFQPNREEIRKDYLDGLHDLQNAFEKIPKEISNIIDNKDPNKKFITDPRDLQSDIDCILKDLWQKEKTAIDSILSNKQMNRLTQWLIYDFNQRLKLLNKILGITKKNKEQLFPYEAEIKSFLATQIFCATKNCKAEDPSKCNPNCEKCEKFESSIGDNPECKVVKRSKEHAKDTNNNIEVIHYYDNIISENSKKLRSLLYDRQNTPVDNGIGLAVLRRWNSYTPGLAKSEGGGYFLYLAKENKVEFGIVIDPGYDFLKNFFAEGFRINDIHAILVSHDHPDHLDDFSTIINLKFEAMKNRGNEENKEPQNKIIAVLSEGSYEKLKTDIKVNKKIFKDTRVISAPESEGVQNSTDLDKYFSVKATKALHLSTNNDDSIGFIITHKKNNIKIGFTGDTKWYEGITDEFNDCQVVCYHAGAIIDEKISLYKCFNEDEFNKFITRTKHLYLPGTLMFSKCFEDKKQLGIISEFGEELKGGLRVDFVNRLAEYIGSKEGDKKRAPIIPSDTGLMVRVDTQEIMCTCCKRFYRYDFIEFEPFGPNERLFSICSNCKNILSENQRQHIYRKKIMEAYTHEAELYI